MGNYKMSISEPVEAPKPLVAKPQGLQQATPLPAASLPPPPPPAAPVMQSKIELNDLEVEEEEEPMGGLFGGMDAAADTIEDSPLFSEKMDDTKRIGTQLTPLFILNNILISLQ